MAQPWLFYKVTRGYTVGHGGDHDGWDFGAPSKTPLISLTGGKVTGHTGWYPWGGEVDTKGGVLGSSVTETFAHADRIDVKPGDIVFPGQQVGLSGGEGLPLKYSNGPHVHYSLFGGAPWDNTKSIDPGNFLNNEIKNFGVGSGLGSIGDIPGVQAIADAINNAATNAENSIAASVKRIGWFILGVLLVAAGIIVIVNNVGMKAGGKALGEAEKIAPLAALA